MKVMCGPDPVAVLLWTLAAPLLLWSGASTTETTQSCQLSSESPSERAVLRRLELLTKKTFTVDMKVADTTYKYVFQLCGDADNVPWAGVVQIDNGTKKTVIGSYNSTQAVGGSDWVLLIFSNGESYSNHCAKEKRKAMVMISCDNKEEIGKLEVIAEDRERPENCFYLFELNTNVLCPVVESHISAGTIIIIIGICLLAVYLIGGFLYQRLVVGAKGVEQFPNYAFWVEFGNLTADGCDFVCRSRPREEAPTYRGVATEPMDEEEQEERDDHLLPM